MIDYIVVFFLVIGTLFIFLAAIGILRMVDLYLRMSSTTKAATLGVGCMLFAVALHFEDVGITARSLAVIFFLFLTAPVAAHVLGRSAYFLGIPVWIKDGKDELKNKYDIETHLLYSDEKEDIAQGKRDIPKDKKNHDKPN